MTRNITTSHTTIVSKNYGSLMKRFAPSTRTLAMNIAVSLKISAEDDNLTYLIHDADTSSNLESIALRIEDRLNETAGMSMKECYMWHKEALYKHLRTFICI